MFLVFMLCYLLNLVVCEQGGRHLVYPPGFGNKVQFIVGIGVPASNLPTIQSVTWGYVIKTNYVLPTNITEYGNSARYMKRSAGVSRWDFYQSVVDVINRTGLNGEECIKRSICETAQIKFSTRDIIGEFLHLMLLPSTTKDTETPYYDAERAGRNIRNNCAALYKKCPLSLIELFSVIRGESAFLSSFFSM